MHGLPLLILVTLAIFLLLYTLVSLRESALSPQIWSSRGVGVVRLTSPWHCLLQG